MRIVWIMILIFASFVQSNKANAWEPCLPFCDARCSGRAALSMGTDISRSFVSLTQQCTELLAALGETNTAIVDMSTSIAENHISQKSNQLSGLDALISRYTLTNDLKGETLASFSDHLSITLHENIKNFLKAMNIMKNEARFGNRAEVSFTPFRTPEDEEFVSEILSKQNSVILENAMIATETSDSSNNSASGVRQSLLNLEEIDRGSLTQRQAAMISGITNNKNTNSALLYLQQINRQKSSTFFDAMSSEQTEHVEHLRNTNFSTQNDKLSINNLLHGAARQGIFSKSNLFAMQQSSEHGLLLTSNRQAQEKNAMLYQMLVQAQSRNTELALKLANAHYKAIDL